MRRKNRDLMVTAIIASLNIIWTLLPNRPIVIGVILTMPLVFFLPGYILTEALFSKRTLIASHHLVLSLALSMAIDIIGGLILNVLPIGLQTLSWHDNHQRNTSYPIISSRADPPTRMAAIAANRSGSC